MPKSTWAAMPWIAPTSTSEIAWSMIHWTVSPSFAASSSSMGLKSQSRSGSSTGAPLTEETTIWASAVAVLVNVYRYCRNAPTLYVDPAGLEEFDLVDFDSPLLSSFEKDLLQRPAVRKWISQTNNGYLDVLVPEFWHSPPGGRSDLAAYLQQTYLFGWFKWLIGAGRPLRLVTVSRAFDQSTYFQGEVRAQRDLVREKVLDAVRQKMATADSGWIELPPIDASPVLEPQLYGEGQLGFALAGAHKLTIHHEVKVCYNKNARGLTNYHFFINSVYGWHDQIDWRGFTEWEKPQFSTWGGTIWVGIESGLLDIPFDKVMAMSYYVLIVYPKLDMGCGVVEIPGSISCDGA